MRFSRPCNREFTKMFKHNGSYYNMHSVYDSDSRKFDFNAAVMDARHDRFDFNVALLRQRGETAVFESRVCKQ